MTLFSRCAALAALLGLAACATQPEIPYDRSAMQDNHTIGLLTPGWPSGAYSVLAGNIGQSFGLIGGLIEAGMRTSRENDLAKILTDKKVDANSLFVADLTSDLKNEGYSVVSVPADQTRSGYLKKYPAPQAGVDSYLDVAVLGYGYIAAGMGASNPYRPYLIAAVKLVRAADGTVLMQDVIAYNPVGPATKAVILSPDPKFAFPVWDNLTADPGNAAAGIAATTHQAAAAIASLVK